MTILGKAHASPAYIDTCVASLVTLVVENFLIWHIFTTLPGYQKGARKLIPGKICMMMGIEIFSR